MLARQRNSFKRGTQSKLLGWIYAVNITKIPAIVWLDFMKQRLVTANRRRVQLFVLKVSLQGRVNADTIRKAVQKWLSHFWPLAETHTPHIYKSNKSCEHLNHLLKFWESWLSQTIFIVIFQISFSRKKNLRRVFILKAPHALTLLLSLVLRVSVYLATSVKGKSKVLLVPKESWWSNSSYQLNYIGPRMLHNFKCFNVFELPWSLWNTCR